MKFTEKEYAFLKNEFGYSKEDVDGFSEDELLDIGDNCFDIETDETLAAGDGKISERGEIAAALVTKINEE